MTKKKICVLGAGPAGLAAASGLSATQELRDQYDVEIYQVGWRAGGKCATGRNKDTYSIEQNCAHYLFGCYDNTFQLIREAYDELHPSEPELEKFDDILLPRNLIALKQKFKGSWEDWLIEFPANSTTPGTEGGEFLSASNYILMVLELMLEAIFGWKIVDKLNHFENARLKHGGTHLADHRKGFFSKIGHWLAAGITRVLVGVSKNRRPHRTWLDSIISFFIKCIRAYFWWLEKGRVEDDLAIQRKWIMIDYSCTTIIGLLDDAVLQEGGFESIDKYDFCEWLKMHGASKYSIDSPFVKLWYQNSLAYIGGDVNRPSMSAGVGLLAQMRAAFTYKGNVAYSLKDEIGDSFIAPLYRSLKARGVKFNFFHRVRDVVPDASGTKLDKLVIERQVSLASGDPSSYDPLMDGKYWPDQPDTSQFSVEDQERYENATGNKDLESFYTTWSGTDIELTHGSDFDAVIFALPLSVIPYYCSSMYNNPDNTQWKNWYQDNPMVESQSLRLWFKPDLKGLGWSYPEPIMSGYITPFCTWEDDSQLLGNQRWPSNNQPNTIACVFGPITAPVFSPGPEDQSYIASQNEVVQASSADFCENLAGVIWPDAGSPEVPNGIDPKNLVAKAPRANCGPLERYTMTWPGGLKTRLKTDETGIQGLYLAGDWIRNGLEAGSMEGATMSGLQASRAISGFPETIVGETDSFY